MAETSASSEVGVDTTEAMDTSENKSQSEDMALAKYSQTNEHLGGNNESKIEQNIDITKADVENDNNSSQSSDGPHDTITRSSQAPLVSQESTISEYSELDAGNSELHLACMDFDKVQVGKLLKQNASVDRTNRRERTCLHEMVATYVSLNLVEQAGLYKKLMDIIVELVTAGLDVNMGDLKWQTPLHYVVRHSNQADVIRALTSSGVKVNAKDRQGQSSLHLAVLDGNINNVQALLEAGGDPNLTDTVGTTAVHMAAKGRHHTEVLKKLLLCGALVDVRDRAQKTPLHEAAKAGRTESVVTLLECRADIMAKDNSGLTPLHLAAGSDMTGKSCQSLLEWGATHNPPIKVNAIDSIYQETPLHRAVRMRMLHNIPLLVYGGAKVKIQDVSGDSALHKASRIYEIWAWKVLMSIGSKYSGLQNRMGLTAFQLAAKANNHIAMSMMRQYGVNDY